MKYRCWRRLRVDYDGSQTNFYASKNYNMQNYANDIVAELKDACGERQLPAPTLISESMDRLINLC